MDALTKVTTALESLGSRRQGEDWSCPGPNHLNGDRRPSLGVTQGLNGVVLYCQAGCLTEEVVLALGLGWDDLFDNPPEAVNGHEIRYPYTDEHGVLLYSKIRKPGKKFALQQADGTWGMGSARRVLYNLPALIAAVKNGEPAYIVEGERDVETLRKKGVTATTNFDGAGKWKDEYSGYFRGADVTIIADRDEPGVQHALNAHSSLKEVAASVRIVQSLTEGRGHDVTDHVEAGHSLDRLVPLRPENEIAKRYRRTNWHEAFKASPDDIDWLYEPVFETGTINALFGRPGVGKSLLTWDFAVTLVREGKRVMVLDDENREQDTVKRLRAFGCTPDELDNLVLYSFAGLPPLDTPEGGEHLNALTQANEPEMVVLDTTTRMVAGDENASNTWLQLYRCSLVPLKQRGITTLRIDHPGKDETRGQRGSSAKAGDVDCIFRLSDISNSDQLVLLCEKSRSGNQEKVITMRRLKDPLRHEVIALGDLDILPQVQGLAGWFDRHGVPRDVGRPRLRDELDSRHGAPSASTTLLALVARFRRGQAEDSAGQQWSSSAGADDHGPF